MTAKATKKAMKIAICSFIDSLAWCHCRMSNVPVLLYRYSSATSVSSEPSSVYRKNLKAAYTRFGPPQTPMMMYIGISVASKNT
ncbi:hypothetical protein D9M69_699230 [compost metagenome]